MDKFEEYMEVNQLLMLEFSKVKISEKQGISRPMVYRYLKCNMPAVVD